MRLRPHQVIRHAFGVIAVIPDGHPLAEPLTDGESLQCGTLTRLTASAVRSARLRILLQPAEILFIVLARDVARVDAREQDPLIARGTPDAFVAIRSHPRPHASEKNAPA